MQTEIEPFEVRSWCFHPKGCYCGHLIGCKKYCTGSDCKNQGSTVLGERWPRYTVKIHPRDGQEPKFQDFLQDIKSFVRATIRRNGHRASR